MNKKTLLALFCCSALGLTACNDDNNSDQTTSTEKVTEPTLISFAKLPVATYAAGPDSGNAVSGANGIYPPFKGQPVQGFSAALKNDDGSYMAMSDNGFGTQDNSADYLLRIYKLKADFKTKTKGTGQVAVQSFIQLRDPNKLIPFEIVNGNSAERLLTGADFDPESMQRAADGSYWIGDEFGPYLLHFSADGVLLDAPIALPHPFNPAQELRSPQNQFNKANINYVEPLVQQSGGFEGMAMSPDGKYLYPLLEKPLLNDSTGRLLISQFDIQKKAYTGQYYWFALDSKATNIGDFQLFNDKDGIIIERDASQNNLGGYKKLIRIQLNEPKQVVARETLVDLMKIANPNALYGAVREGDIGTGHIFAFPFETIEDVIIENATTLTVLNDNNFPGSSGRNAKLADDNEIIQIRLPKALF
ncbi:esterase-like activity of phytase family protein [Acinetobacter sp. NIPH 2699]|uniref:esterase-like activity of phytase family protein n=1 Tax=Acinetobacter sp. NIPH 2699 TaxID=2923433 RepID=UPI001F4B2D3E|nr:esterase-like activity of phytase family protein [Acinetobacter sp. NIPH 2699]MCH7335306.1 esterase-like activity of phytase family protein [Acinetobacter sp. NIPH 2699]